MRTQVDILRHIYSGKKVFTMSKYKILEIVSKHFQPHLQRTGRNFSKKRKLYSVLVLSYTFYTVIATVSHKQGFPKIHKTKMSASTVQQFTQLNKKMHNRRFFYVEEVPQKKIPISYNIFFCGTSSTSAAEEEAPATEEDTPHQFESVGAPSFGECLR